MFSAKIDTSRFADSLRAKKREMHAATVRGTVKAGHVLERDVKKTLTGSSGSPGSPPALRTGTLRRSVQVGALVDTGTGAMISVYPSTVYARIQELGGTITPKRARRLAWQTDGHWVTATAVTLPPRPYLAPTFARDEADGSLRDAFTSEWSRVWGGDF